VTGGHVRLNGERTAPGARVKTGDCIDLVRERLRYVMEVSGLPNRRGPASEARSYYCEDPASVAAREAQSLTLKQDRILMPKTPGRPDKHTRRKLREQSRGD
jgi:ribosome-associated heat shock protein Hsp15